MHSNSPLEGGPPRFQSIREGSYALVRDEVGTQTAHTQSKSNLSSVRGKTLKKNSLEALEGAHGRKVGRELLNGFVVQVAIVEGERLQLAAG